MKKVFVEKSQFESFQPQAIGHHRYGTECHGEARQHWIEQKSGGWIQNPRRNRNPDQVVNEGPKKVLADGSYRAFGQMEHLGQCT